MTGKREKRGPVSPGRCGSKVRSSQHAVKREEAAEEKKKSLPPLASENKPPLREGGVKRKEDFRHVNFRVRSPG